MRLPFSSMEGWPVRANICDRVLVPGAMAAEEVDGQVVWDGVMGLASLMATRSVQATRLVEQGRRPGGGLSLRLGSRSWV